MAFVINPDGTINVLDVQYDRLGNVRPKRIVESYGNSPSQQTKKPKKKNKNKHRATIKLSSAYVNSYPETAINKVVIPEEATPETILQSEVAEKGLAPTTPNVTKPSEKKKIFQTKEAIDEYFNQRKELRQIIHQEILDYATKHLDKDLLTYFTKCFNEHNAYCKSKGWEPKIPEMKPRKKRKEAAFTPVGDSSNRRFGNSRHPVYGYARDKYGRVQERDSLNEERKNEFRQSQTLQRSYDYSNYDSESDHDSYYDSNSYD